MAADFANRPALILSRELSLENVPMGLIAVI